ncbi:Ctr copper transporter [Phanerochaete sordida]|uniref:Copper transport protein n=1 Tax=Phanerochaete sordida TaxID=48140 RepID=A0A9P3GID5_9APHY|nr:Ctr copper transporter [Phanerochaete sordida]
MTDSSTGSGSMGSMGSSTTASNSTMNMSMDMMKMYFHFTPGDIVLFSTIVPSSPGAVLGTCLFFFFVSIFNCWLRAYRRGVEKQFVARARRLTLRRYDSEHSVDQPSLPKEVGAEESVPVPHAPTDKFLLSNELARGALNGIGETLHYALMLVVMTYNASYIIAIIVGSVVGEVAFGRLNRC